MYLISKRIFDLISSLSVLLILSPFLILIAIIIMIDSKGGPFYFQERVGKNQKTFKLIKFRSMRVNSDKSGQITIGADSRITKVGHFIRRTKLDELPQLINIIIGQMSVVGPRPEVPKYVALYSDEQLKVLTVKPGLSDFASIKFIKEQDILGKEEDPDKAYIEKIMPEKLALSLKYIKERNFFLDLKIIFKTISKIG